LRCHSVVVLTLVRTKQIRINTHKRNDTQKKNTIETIQNTVNTSTHINKIATRYKTHTYTHPHITEQVKTTPLQVKTTTGQDKLCIIACNSNVFKQRSEFDPKIVHEEFLVNKVALVQSYLRVHRSPVRNIHIR